MGEQLQRGDAAVAAPPRRWPRRVLWVVVLAGAAIAIARSGARRSGQLDCATAARAGTEALAAVVCQQEYERTRRPAAGAALADVLRRSGDPSAAAGLATELLGTPARADALAILGQIAAAQRRLDDAAGALLEARRLHRAEDRRRELARDELALADVQRLRDQHAEALLSLDECIADARSAADAPTEGACHVAAARVLARVGAYEAAHQELDRAEPRLALDRDLAGLWLERGTLDLAAGRDAARGAGRRGQGERAVRALERALEHAARARLTELALAIHLRLADALAELRQPERAERHLAEAGLLDRDRRTEHQRAQLAARIAYRRGDLDLAAAMGERAYAALVGDGDAADERIALAVMEARIALASNDLAAAERWARRGVEVAEQIRGAQAAAELRPWVLAGRREAFEVLFKVLALAGRADDAALVLDRWQGRALFDAMARPGPDPAQGLAGAAGRVRSLGQWLPAAAGAPLLQGGGRAALEPLRGIDLIALAVADGDVWRLTASRGRLRLEPRGALEDLAERLDRFADAPTDRALADELGALLLPDDAARATDEPLYVVLDAPLAALPVVALRRGGRPLVAARPVLRAPRLPAASRCAAPAAAGAAARALILADAAGDLPDARRDASSLASQLETTARVGEGATAAALLAVPPGALLHVAVHAGGAASVGALRLYDRALTAPELAASRLPAALVVLAGGSAAPPTDPALAASLATAFLAAGAGRVVAALRPVSDAGARELSRRFYAAGGAADPVRALARVQAELAAEGGADWPRFAAFGADACAPRS